MKPEIVETLKIVLPLLTLTFHCTNCATTSLYDKGEAKLAHKIPNYESIIKSSDPHYIDKMDQKKLVDFKSSMTKMINDMIDHSTREHHIPGYNFVGFGTKLRLKLLKGVQPVNKLDEAAMYHDLAYAKSEELDPVRKNRLRNAADKELEQKAWERAKAADSTDGEKSAASLVGYAMLAKEWLNGDKNSSNN